MVIISVMKTVLSSIMYMKPVYFNTCSEFFDESFPFEIFNHHRLR